MEKKSFILYLDLAEVVDEMEYEDAGKLFKAIFHWQRHNEIPTDIDNSIKFALLMLISQFKRDITKWEDISTKRSKAGRNGAKQKLANAGKRKQAQANAGKCKQRLANQAVNVNVNDNVNVNVNDNSDYSLELNEISSKPVMEFPCVGDQKQWKLLEEKLTEWQNTYQAIDVLDECKKARQWIIDSPSRKKTARGMTKFLNGWLCRATNSYRPSKGGGPMEVA